ncbi:ABC transporter permease subunit [Kribbella sp. HUAS MG21]|uniref:ABC transporter permease subunit n=1 Tax=Kribbella sp. HUAS MG21 TaxID=3160966 RepID=A0AAU7TNR9_9ACTN
MIWLTWRQFRVQFLVVAGVVLATAVFLAATGAGLVDDYQRLTDKFIDNLAFQPVRVWLYRIGLVLLYAVPPVIGAFWGAPMIARELEAGTHRLVWGQGISRTRWLAVKIGVTGLAAMAVTGLLSLAVTWWADPIDDAADAGLGGNDYLPRMFPPTFAARGLVPVGYAAFAFALGAVLGLVIRRTLVAVAVTLAVVILVQAFTPVFLRPHLMAPTEQTLTLTKDNVRGFMVSGDEANPKLEQLEVASGSAGAWKFSDKTVDRSGAEVSTLPSWAINCAPQDPHGPPRDPKEQAACYQQLESEGYKQHIKYFTADKFWALQWREFGLFLALAVLLTGFSFWRIRRDLS